MWEKWVVNWFAKKTSQEVVLTGTHKTTVASLHPPLLGAGGWGWGMQSRQNLNYREGASGPGSSVAAKLKLWLWTWNSQGSLAPLGGDNFGGTFKKKDPHQNFLRAHWEMSSPENFLINFHWTTLIFSSLNHRSFRKQKMRRRSCLLPPERWHIWFKEKMLWEQTKDAPRSPKRFRRETKKESNPGWFGLFFLNFCMAMRGT